MYSAVHLPIFHGHTDSGYEDITKSFMKNIFILWMLFSFLTVTAYGQSVTFSFIGKTLNEEALVNIDSVYIFNVTNGSDTLVPGNTFTTSITSIDVSETDRKNALVSYPNPFREEINIKFNSNLYERAKVVLYSLDGKSLAEWNNVISIGENKFRLKSGKKGVLLLNIVSKNIQLNTTLICLKESDRSEINQISYFSDDYKNLFKSVLQSSSFDFSLGDSLNFKGYSGI